MKAHITCFFISSFSYFKFFIMKIYCSILRSIQQSLLNADDLISGVVMNEPLLSRSGDDEDLEY